jgi:hypothetical protein
MSDEKIIRLINREKWFAENIDETSAYNTGYIDGLKMALKIIRDHDSAVLDAMASYYEGV